MCWGPQASEIGKFEARQRLTVVRTLCGQASIGPSGVDDQSMAPMSFAISPPPARNCTVLATISCI
jgi:hypothetical protein